MGRKRCELCAVAGGKCQACTERIKQAKRSYYDRGCYQDWTKRQWQCATCQCTLKNGSKHMHIKSRKHIANVAARLPQAQVPNDVDAAADV